MSKANNYESDLRELICAFDALLAAAIDYVDYEHDGDPWSEDAREMGEMDLDDLKRKGKLDEYRLLLDRCRTEFIDDRED
ncbi:MAG: hypothetical protein JAY90_20145 [Candidatus Thiodiazotropha lotti]|nr:hypothetical protein [Candidatus Thiodiazotropha lotti]